MDKQILRTEWPSFADQFSETNQGRPVSIELIGDVLGDEPMAENVSLVALDYDDQGRQAILITVRQGEGDFTHTVLDPKAVWLHRDPDGRALAMEILTEDNVKTILRFEDV